MTAAHQLSLKGYKVTVFEAEPEPGGMLYCAIPEYRLPRDVITREIQSLLDDHIDIICNTSLGEDFTVEWVEEVVHRSSFRRTDLHSVVQNALNIATSHFRTRILRDVHLRIVVKFLGELDTGHRREGTLCSQ